MLGYVVKKHDLFTRKSRIFDMRITDGFIINSEFDFKTSSFEMALRDERLSLIAKMPYMITDVIDVATDELRLYLLRQNKTVDVYRVSDQNGMSHERTINIATMCRRNVCAPCCSCFWTTPTSLDMEFKVRKGRLFFKSAHRVWMFEARGGDSDGPIGSFSLRPGKKPGQDESDQEEVERDIIRTNWFVNSRDEIIVHLMDEQKLVWFDFGGEVLFERDLSDFPNPLKLSFCLDNDESVFFYDNENIYT